MHGHSQYLNFVWSWFPNNSKTKVYYFHLNQSLTVSLFLTLHLRVRGISYIRLLLSIVISANLVAMSFTDFTLQHRQLISLYFAFISQMK